MRYRTVKEASAFLAAMMAAKQNGQREFLGAKMDSVPAWVKTDGRPVEHKLDGSEVEAVYLAYRPPTEKQKDQALPAKLAGVRLERISGRLVDIRTCADGSVQVLLTNGLRDAEGKVAFRGPNVTKGILCYLGINEGLGEPVAEILERVPAEMIEKLRANKLRLGQQLTTGQPELPVAEETNGLPEKVSVPRGPSIMEPQEEGDSRFKLR